MNDGLRNRWNQVLERLQSKELHSNKGLGNEIGFYIFDYPPEAELQIRESLQILMEQLKQSHPDLNVTHINLFKVLTDYLKERNLLENTFKLQKDKGDLATKKALKEGPLRESRFSKYLEETVHPVKHDLVLISGVGNMYPLIRTHTLLSNLHSIFKGTPLVMMYPGIYDGQSLKLFNILENNNYYRAFKLVP